MLFYRNIPIAELKEWPYEGVCTVTQRFQMGVFNLCLCNVSLSVEEQVIRLIIIFLLGSYVSIMSPYSEYTQDALPGLGTFVLAAIVALYVFHSSSNIDKNSTGRRLITGTAPGLFHVQIQKDELMVHVARLMLGAIYMHYILRVLADTLFHNGSAEHIIEVVFDLTKVTVITCIGSVATGVFKTNIDRREELEVKVRERTKQIRSKNIELRRINIAFEACETAIAMTDASRNVIWTNQAFETLAKRTKGIPRDESDISNVSAFLSSVGQQLTDVILLDGSINESKLRGAFDFLSPRRDEIEIDKGQYCVDVTPFEDDVSEMISIDEDDESVESAAAVFSTKLGKSRRGSGSSRRRGSFQSNRHTLFLVAFRDMTAHRAKEKAEQNARDESLLSKAMKESMVTLTHELRTPLQGIMGITSLMLEQQNFERNTAELTSTSFSKDNIESLGLIMASSSLLLNLINNLLDVKKATANMMDEFLLAPLLASEPIRDAIDFCNPLASISNVNIEMDCCGKTAEVFVNANALRLQQVLINMISNAIKYTDQGTTIRVSTRPSTVGKTIEALQDSIACCSSWDDQESFLSESPDDTPILVFSVCDSGPGIEMDQARHLFQRYMRLSKEPTRTLGSKTVGQPSGTGLGLNLCQMFIQRMRGSIWVDNNAGRGSTFSFCLPLVRKELTQIASILAPSVGLQTSPKKRRCSPVLPISTMLDYRDLRVLVVDDTLINRKVLDRMLKKIGVSHISTAESGEDALDELYTSGNHYDLVVTDLQMPGMSGVELTEAIFQKQQALEEQEGPQPIVVVGLTADTSPGVAEKCALSGMSDLLYKPITLVEIQDYFSTKIGKLQPGRWSRGDGAAYRGDLRCVDTIR